MKYKILALTCCLFYSHLMLAAESSCIPASKLWSWIEKREKKITARAQCGGIHFKKRMNDDFLTSQLLHDGKNYTKDTSWINRLNGCPTNQNPKIELDMTGLEEFSYNLSKSYEQPISPMVVSVESSEDIYLSSTENLSREKAEASTIEKLKIACAKQIMIEKSKIDQSFSGNNNELSIFS